MRDARIVMGMPVSVEIVGVADGVTADRVFAYFAEVDRRFSTYKPESEIERINRGEIAIAACSEEMREVLTLAEKTGRESGGYFDMRRPNGTLDPSGIVKGWAIRNAANLIASTGARDFFINAGGDIQSCGNNATGEPWRVGIRSPFKQDEIIRVVYPRGRGIATSGTYVRGQHIYDPGNPGRPIDDIVSLTVIAADILEADRFATAAFAMGGRGIAFIEATPGLEGYLVHADGRATMTSGFQECCAP
jgi:thiamine biosynthesis lipoprotein